MFRKNRLEIGFFSFFILLCLFLLWKVMALKFLVHDQIGPAVYPFVFLMILLIISVILLAKTFTADYIQIFSPFLQGLNEDQLIRKIGPILSGILGQPVRVKTQDGIGRFSAVWKGKNAAADGKTLIVLSSDTSEMPNLYAAGYALSHVDPLARLFFIPDVLIVRNTSEVQDLQAFLSRLTSDGDPIRIGIKHNPKIDYSVEKWLAANAGESFRATPEEDYSDLRQKLLKGDLDALICGMDDAGGDLSEETAMKALAVFSDRPMREFPEIPITSFNGAAMASGKWAGMALPKGVSEPIRRRMEAALSEICETPRYMEVLEKEGIQLDYLNRKEFIGFLDHQKQILEGLNHGTDTASMESGKIVGLWLAITLTFLFAFAMQWIGFPFTAIFFLMILISSLWTNLNKRAMVMIAGISVGVSLSIYFIFWQIFYVVFPGPSLFGG